jgi:hypothetical protein
MDRLNEVRNNGMITGQAFDGVWMKNDPVSGDLLAGHPSLPDSSWGNISEMQRLQAQAAQSINRNLP